jgi:hypothetical protein
VLMRLSENGHLQYYPHPLSLRRTSMYASFLGISSRRKACGMVIFHQPLRSLSFESLNKIKVSTKKALTRILEEIKKRMISGMV